MVCKVFNSVIPVIWVGIAASVVYGFVAKVMPHIDTALTTFLH